MLYTNSENPSGPWGQTHDQAEEIVDGNGLNKKVLISCLAVTTLVGLAGCGAGSKTAEKTSTKVACDFTNPPAATTVNVLAYNSSAVDPYSNTMVSSCTPGERDGEARSDRLPGSGPEDDRDIGE